MKPFLLVALSLGWFGLGAQAQAPTTVAPAASTPSLPVHVTLKTAQDLVRVDELWSKTLEWNELGASTDDILAHIKKALDTEAPPIEVRVKTTLRSTFALKKAPLGPTLSSLATLLDAEVWVFPGRLVLAPETALTPDERALITQTLGGKWKERGIKWDSFEELNKVAIPLIGSEIKERFAAKGGTVPAADDGKFFNGLLPYELTWTELSPATQQLLQELIEVNSRRTNRPTQKPTLDASVIVGFEDRYSQWVLFLQKPTTKEDGTAGRQNITGWAPVKPQPPAVAVVP